MMERKEYIVSGMSCAACSARVEKAVSVLSGVKECHVNLLTCTLAVFGEAAAEDVINAVLRAGYGAEEKDSQSVEYISEKNKHESRRILGRLVASFGLLLALMYISMGHIMWGFPLPGAFANSPIAIGIVQAILSASVLVINYKFFVSGARALIKLSPNMDSLVAIGSFTSFAYSLVLLVIMAGSSMPHELLHGLYFESAAMIPALVSLGKLLESLAKGRTTDAIRSLADLSPKWAVRLTPEGEERIKAEDIIPGDVILVRRGESIAADGIVIFGNGAADESFLTGESIPVDKTVGSKVYSGTNLLFGFVQIRVEAAGESTALFEIIRMVNEATSSRAPVSKLADKVAGTFVPVVMGIALLAGIVWLLLGEAFGFAMARAVSVLVISCPCALGLATPVAITVACGVGAKNKILYKNAEALEVIGKIKTVCIDKTGTITTGHPTVAEIVPISLDEGEILKYAASLEYLSEHPLAVAIVSAYSGDRLECTDFSAHQGGVVGKIEGVEYFLGNTAFSEVRLGHPINREIIDRIDILSNGGCTSLIFAKGCEIIGIIALKDQIKHDSKDAISAFNKMDISTVMLTGDNEKCAAAVAGEVGITAYYGGLFPADKQVLIEKSKTEGTVAMIGDGINDSPSLVSADIGIAIGTGADVAIDSADILLTGGSLADAVDAVRLGKTTLRIIMENLFWAFCYNIIGIPLAAGVFIPFGLTLEPMFGAMAMSISSFLVVINSLRINLFKPTTSVSQRDISDFSKYNVDCNINENTECEEANMNKTFNFKVDGMMCGHCVARVKSALEAAAGVVSAEVMLEDGAVTVVAGGEATREAFIEVIENAGYTVLDK